MWILLLGGLAAISGIFFPITHLPTVLQWTGQAFLVYWLGLGMRSALLPNAMAPVVLRRMARRESGSNVAARREKAMRRT